MGIWRRAELQGCMLVLLGLGLGGCSAPPYLEPSARETVVFSDVVSQVQPVAERQCRAQAPEIDCRFSISLVRDPDLQANAYYHRLPSGAPRIVVTQSLLETLQNADELALILGHEAAHHIAGHFLARSESALSEALAHWIAAEDAGLKGVDLSNAAQAGAKLGARRFSKQFELEADQLGAVIARDAGYDPVKAVAYLERAYDPGNQHMGTHPPNSQRIRLLKGQMHRQ